MNRRDALLLPSGITAILFTASRSTESNEDKEDVQSRTILYPLTIRVEKETVPRDESLKLLIEIFCSEPAKSGEFFLVCGFKEYSGVASFSFTPCFNEIPLNSSPIKCSFGPGGWLLQKLKSDNVKSVRLEIEKRNKDPLNDQGSGFVAKDYRLLFRK